MALMKRTCLILFVLFVTMVVNFCGKCMRSFHATVDAGEKLLCKTLGFSGVQVESFLCKNCQYKQYQCFSCGELGSFDTSTGAENDFKFEKRDWMIVKPSELPTGSHLIMGLNSPFGVQAALANMFVDKAFEFKPKLFVLVVLQETQKVIQKETTL